MQMINVIEAKHTLDAQHNISKFFRSYQFSPYDFW